MSPLPLLPELPGDPPLAWRDGRSVARSEFLGQVLALAAQLEPGVPVLNLCGERYWFAVGLCAAIVRGCNSLLPHSSAPEQLAAIAGGTPAPRVLVDQDAAPLSGLRADSVASAAPWHGPMPQVDAAQPVATVFTSGSTGTPQPHHKRFGGLRASLRVSSQRLWGVAGGPCAVLGTVPFRHMFGLESSVLLPLLGGGSMASSLPFFPADMVAALAALPAPRLLVTTPFHLRKLVDAGLELPDLACVLSATAPLPVELARQTEAAWRAPVMEIYGSTETGQFAMRRPVLEPQWTVFDDIRIRQEDGRTTAEGGHLEGPQTLHDVLELHGGGRFSLLDRNANIINVVGKRSSLAFLNHTLLGLPGVQDGAFWLPGEGSAGEVARLAAFVVAPGLRPADIVQGLRAHLDPVFLPRPVVMLPALPRDGNGKLTLRALKELADAHLPRAAG